jgi:hypothetical protein
MKNVNYLFLAVFLCIHSFVFGQVNAIKFKILPYYSSYQRSLNDTSFQLNNATDYKIDVLRFYISNVRFYKGDSLVYQEQNKAHLCDASIHNSNRFLMSKSEKVSYDKVQFELGIDSITNVSGALGGALDPTNGMYWTWQSGYINFKLEGRSNSCDTRTHEFQFHLGGYSSPFSSLQTISFNIKNARDFILVLDLSQLLNNIDLSKQNHIMSPSNEAVKFSKLVAQSFRYIEQ